MILKEEDTEWLNKLKIIMDNYEIEILITKGWMNAELFCDLFWSSVSCELFSHRGLIKSKQFRNDPPLQSINLINKPNLCGWVRSFRGATRLTAQDLKLPPTEKRRLKTGDENSLSITNDRVCCWDNILCDSCVKLLGIRCIEMSTFKICGFFNNGDGIVH